MVPMRKGRIGVIGYGFLGRALVHGFSLHSNIKIYDKFENYYDSLEDVVDGSDFLFISVPTPMSETGAQDLSSITDAVESVVGAAEERKTIVIRSTVIPGTTRSFAEKHTDHDFIFFPEFLTERTSRLDFINSSRFIFGGDSKEALSRVEALFRNRFVHTPIFKTTWEAAEIVKYMCNCFFAVKISYLNEIYDIAKHYGIDYDELKPMWLSDFRIGNSHADVPGHDGLRGYGGNCFPKDVKAFVAWAESNGMELNMCKAADVVNERVRVE